MYSPLAIAVIGAEKYAAPNSVRASAGRSGNHGFNAFSRSFKCEWGAFDRKAHFRTASRALASFSSTSAVEPTSSSVDALAPSKEEERSFSSEVEDIDSSVTLPDQLLDDLSDDGISPTSSLILRIISSVSLRA
nr:unnamed protein product [Spirometra erinaceieuropaei]